MGNAPEMDNGNGSDSGYLVGEGIALGAALGLLFGLMLGNLALCVASGVVGGLLIAAAVNAQRRGRT